MTRRGDRDASERRSGLGEDEKQPVKPRPRARWRRSNLVILVTFGKGNHRGKACLKRSQRKALKRRERETS